MLDRRSFASSSLAGLALAALPEKGRAAEKPGFRLKRNDERLDIRWQQDGAQHALASFVFADMAIRRPYFANVAALPRDVRLTRNHPPQQGDAADHATMHPGVWLAFGDLSGHDFWRNQGRVVQEKFARGPELNEAGAELAFTSLHRYESADGTAVARETFVCQMRQAESGAWSLAWDSTLEAAGEPLVFGDQEEMGLGVRMATALTVKSGGTILDSHGRKNEKEIWGQSADWCYYGNRGQGVLLMAHPENFQKSRFHVRDYGLMVANCFAAQAFDSSRKPARTVVKPGEKLRLRYGLVLHASGERDAFDPAAQYEAYR